MGADHEGSNSYRMIQKTHQRIQHSPLGRLGSRSSLNLDFLFIDVSFHRLSMQLGESFPSILEQGVDLVSGSQQVLDENVEHMTSIEAVHPQALLAVRTVWISVLRMTSPNARPKCKVHGFLCVNSGSQL